MTGPNSVASLVREDGDERPALRGSHRIGQPVDRCVIRFYGRQYPKVHMPRPKRSINAGRDSVIQPLRRKREIQR